MKFVAFEHPPPSKKEVFNAFIPPRPILQQKVMPFDAWMRKYNYFVDCVWSCIVTYMKNNNVIILNSTEVKQKLDRYLYNTSINKLYAYDLLK